MTDRPTVADLADNQPAEIDLLVLSKRLQTTKNGQPYLRLELGDSSGRVEAVAWEGAQRLADRFEEGDVIAVRGRAGRFQGRPQITITDLTRLEPDSYDLGRFLASADRPVEEMLAEVEALAAGLGEPLRGLVQAVLNDPELAPLLPTAPAAKFAHHGYVGGLVEHTLAVARAAEAIAGLYSFLHRDLLVAGALLHDLGKAFEFQLSPAPDYTTAGRLIGHVVLGVDLVRRHLPPDIDPGLAEEIIHLIVSHHGQRDFGSPQLPQTLEAVALHLADDLDAKMAGMKTRLDEADGPWTDFIRIYERYLFAGSENRPPDSTAPADLSPDPKPARKPKPKTEPEPEPDPGLFS